MRIAIDARALTAPQKTGVAMVTDALIRELAEKHPADTFFLFATGNAETLLNIPSYPLPNISLVSLQIPNKVANMLWKLPFGPCMERFLPEKPDVWLFPHAHIQHTKLPYVVLFHDATLRAVPEFFTLKDHARAFVAQEEKIFRNAKSVIAVSEHSKEDAQTFYNVPTEKIRVAPLGVDHKAFLPREQPSDRSYRAAYDLNRPYLLWIATREPRKNVDSVIRAYSLFRERGGISIPLVLAGPQGWKTCHITAALAESKFRPDIRELFYVPEKHKPALYRGATAFLFPSFYEGFGLPVLEAMACGVPVITSITSSLPEVSGDAAILVDPLNVNAIAQAIQNLLHVEDGLILQKKLRERGVAQAEKFSWSTTADAVYAELIRENSLN